MDAPVCVLESEEHPRHRLGVLGVGESAAGHRLNTVIQLLLFEKSVES